MWPHVLQSGDTTFATYEPIVTSWKDDELQARVAVAVYTPGAKTPRYGEVLLEVPTRTQPARGVVTLGDVRITQARFPPARRMEAEYAEVLRGAQLLGAKTVVVDRLQREVEYGATERAAPTQPGNKAPPAILFTDRPATLVQVDGAPQLRKEGDVKRVGNTRALLLSDRGAYFVWIGDHWYRAASIGGEYTVTREVPPAVDPVKVRLAASREIDLLPEAEPLRNGTKVVVSTKPATLVETRGAPTYERVDRTTLSWLSNTDADVLRDETTNQLYVLVAGRWFRASSTAGPWTSVAGKDLPSTFRDIPRDHREARVLASIPDTAEAEEAKSAATIPQTAVVDRAYARLSVTYDEDPDFRPIEGTTAPISYALNSSTPVIAASDGRFYAVENGVWFVSTSPNGPWSVATSVPDVIYSIPQDSPVHNVTYVRVYGYSPDYAYVGYLPGYLGLFYVGGVIALDAAFGPWWYGPYDYGAYGYHGYYGHRPWGRYHRGGYPPHAGRGWPGPTAGGGVYHRWAPSVVRAPPAYPVARPRIEAPPARVPASPSVGASRAPTVRAPSYVPRTSSPSITSAPYYSPAQPNVGVRRAAVPRSTALDGRAAVPRSAARGRRRHPRQSWRSRARDSAELLRAVSQRPERRRPQRWRTPPLKTVQNGKSHGARGKPPTTVAPDCQSERV